MAREILGWGAVGGAALALAAFTAAGHTDASPRPATPDPLRQAFDLSVSHCYATREHEALRACLAEVMDVHLQALGARGAAPAAPPPSLPRPAPRSDV